MRGILARLRAWYRGDQDAVLAEARAAVDRLEAKVRALREEIESRYGGTE